MLCVDTCLATESPLSLMTQKLQAIHSLSADFTQNVQLPSGQSIGESSGRLVIAKPAKFYWSVEKPSAQLLIAQGGELLYFQPDLAQVTYRHLTADISQTPAAFLLNNDEATVAAHYKVTQVEKDTFELIPRDANNLVRSVELHFEGNTLSQLVMWDQLGHVTTITLHHVVVNHAINNSLFLFTPPKNVDVIHE